MNTDRSRWFWFEDKLITQSPLTNLTWILVIIVDSSLYNPLLVEGRKARCLIEKTLDEVLRSVTRNGSRVNKRYQQKECHIPVSLPLQILKSNLFKWEKFENAIVEPLLLFCLSIQRFQRRQDFTATLIWMGTGSFVALWRTKIDNQSH